MPTRVTATTQGGNQVLTRALTLTCLPWYNPPGDNTPHRGRPPKLALGTKGQAGPSCTNEVTPESSPALRMDTPQSFETDIREILLRGNPRIPPNELVSTSSPATKSRCMCMFKLQIISPTKPYHEN